MSREILPRGYEAEQDESPPMPRTVVSGLLTTQEATARVNQLDSDIFSLDNAVDAELKAIKQRASTLPGKIPSESDQTTIKLVVDFQSFKLDWSSFKAKGVFIDSEPQLYGYEMRFRQIRKQWDSLPGVVKPATPVSPEPEKPEPITKPITDGLHSIENIVKWGAIGALGYLGYKTFIAAPKVIHEVKSTKTDDEIKKEVREL